MVEGLRLTVNGKKSVNRQQLTVNELNIGTIMQLTMLKSKIHRATVTSCDKEYNGSIAIDSAWMKEIGILPNEQVDVYNITNGNRFTTYAIEAEAGSKTIGVRGAAVHLVDPGDLVIICAYCILDENEAKSHKPKVMLAEGRI
jgi:aspartate 1-decarboxylase